MQDSEVFESDDGFVPRDVQALKLQLSEKDNILHQVLKNYENLKQQVKTDIKDVQRTHQYQEDVFDAEIRKMKAMIERLQNQKRIIEQEKIDYKERCEDLNQELNSLTHEYKSKKDELSIQLESLQAQENQFKVENKSLQEKVKLMESEGTDNLQLALNEKNRLLKEIEKFKQRLDKSRGEKETLNSQLHELREQIQNNLQQDSIHSEEVKDLKDANVRLQKELKEKTKMMAKANEDFHKEMTQLEQEKAQLKQQILLKEKEQRLNVNEKETFKSSLQDLQVELSKTKKGISSQEKDMADLIKKHELENNHLKIKINDLERQNKILKKSEDIYNQEKTNWHEEKTKLAELCKVSKDKASHFESAYETRLNRLNVQLKVKEETEKKLKAELLQTQELVVKAKAHHNEHSERAKELEVALEDMKRQKEAYENQATIEIKNLSEQVRLLKNENKIIQEEKEQIITKFNDVQNKLKLVENSNHDIERGFEAKINHLSQSLEQVDKQKRILEKERETYQQDKIDIQKNLNETIEQVRTIKREKQDLANKAEAENNKIRIKLEDAETSNKNLTFDLEQAVASRQLIHDQFKDLTKEHKETVNDMENQIKTIEVKLQKAAHAYQRLQSDVENAHKENEKLRGERNELIKTVEAYLMRRQHEAGDGAAD